MILSHHFSTPETAFPNPMVSFHPSLRPPAGTPDPTLLTQLAVITILTNLDDPNGQGLRITASGQVEFGLTLQLLSDAIASPPGQPSRPALRSALMCRPAWLATPLCAATRERVANVGALNLLLRWLADIRNVASHRKLPYRTSLASMLSFPLTGCDTIAVSRILSFALFSHEQ